jgi:hypothetical protein
MPIAAYSLPIGANAPALWHPREGTVESVNELLYKCYCLNHCPYITG